MHDHTSKELKQLAVTKISNMILYDISPLQHVFHYVCHIFLLYHENSTPLHPTWPGLGGCAPPPLHPTSTSIPGLKTESFAIINLLCVSTKTKLIMFTKWLKIISLFYIRNLGKHHVIDFIDIFNKINLITWCFHKFLYKII